MAPPPTTRLECVDALRGLAMLWMTLFHLAFDLNQAGYIRQDFYHDALWTGQRTLIVALFLGCAGIGQALARGQSWAHFGRRWAQILGGALLVTAGSWWLYPQSFIYFGVLHGIALMLIVARLTAHWGRWLWLAGALAIAIKYIAVELMMTPYLTTLAEIFNTPWLNWLGLITRKPITEDYVPLLPWLGVMWWGVAAGDWLNRRRAGHWLRGAVPARLQPLAWLGRHSLSYYLLHQPLLLGGLLVWGWLYLAVTRLWP